MLTNKQIEQLEQYTKHPKYGKLLQNAMDVWEGKINPTYAEWGIYLDSDIFCNDYEFDDDGNEIKKRCCLIGASLLNKKVSYDQLISSCLEDEIYAGTYQHFGISQIESISLWHGFDGYSKEEKYDEDAFNFGLKIREILFPND